MMVDTGKPSGVALERTYQSMLWRMLRWRSYHDARKFVLGDRVQQAAHSTFSKASSRPRIAATISGAAAEFHRPAEVPRRLSVSLPANAASREP